MLHLGVLGSGAGSNLQALIEAIDEGRVDAGVVCVLADRADAFILERARRRGIPAYAVDCRPFRSKLEGPGEVKAIELLHEHGADTVALAGFMRIVKPSLLRAFPGRILNVHPSLLPAFPGLHAWKQALDYGARITGCTVHFVDEGMDTGPIITQRSVAVLSDDTPETLHARIQAEEHIAYAEAVQWLAEGRLTMEGRRVHIAPGT